VFGLDKADGRITWRGTAGWRGLAAWLDALAGRRADAERLRAESARELGAMGSYEEAMAALGLGEHEPSPGCNPVFDPLHELRSFQELMRRYGIKMCEAG